MKKYAFFLACVALGISQYAHAAKLIIKNNEDFAITVYLNYDWSTITIGQGENKVAYDSKDTSLKALSAYEKGSTSKTIKKYRLKEEIIDAFNKALMSDQETTVNFPEDFDVLVSLRLRRSFP